MLTTLIHDPVWEKVQQRIAGLASLMLRKGTDYRWSALKAPTLVSGVTAKQAILVRMSDKIKRYEQIVRSGDQSLVDESLEETLMDLVNYGILALSADDLDAECLAYLSEELPDDEQEEECWDDETEVGGELPLLGQERLPDESGL